jgi:nuclear transport factor 2 (NTF2) superfamily protein
MTDRARPPLQPFARESALLKVRMAEVVWNSHDPERVALAYTPDGCWRGRPPDDHPGLSELGL